ncbi:MAG: TolC family protein, partial [Bacteroidaceae bacterium]|nr:TolC family protein [Bacteroidaceae bacterium]
MRSKLILTLACILLLTTSCSLYRRYEAHETVPSDIMGDVVQTEDTLSMGAVSWQQMFPDPQLQQLITQALQNNTDVQQAQLTVQQAQNDLATARLGWLPIITFNPSGTLERLGGVATNSYIVPLTASWQLNIFG